MTELDRIAEHRRKLQAELAELDIAERVIRRISGNVPVRKPGGRKPSPDGIPAQHASVLAILDANGGSMVRSALLEAINAQRETPMGEGTYAALLSKMGALVTRADGRVGRAARPDGEERGL